MLQEELAQLIAERDAITARIRELRVQLKTDRRELRGDPDGDFVGLTSRAAGFLRRAGFRTRTEVEELYRRDGRAGITRLRRIGPLTADEIVEWLNPRA